MSNLTNIRFMNVVPVYFKMINVVISAPDTQNTVILISLKRLLIDSTAKEAV